MSNKLISIVIPTHNRKEKLARLIESVQNSNYDLTKLEIVVVDDASTDNTSVYIKNRFPVVKIIRNESERLLAASRNIGITNSIGAYVFVIDDDNVVEKNCISELTKVLDSDASIGLCGPISYYYCEKQRVWSAGVRTDLVTSVTTQIARDDIDRERRKKLIECEVLINAFMIRRPVVCEIGLFNDKDFPIHYDEADFCERVRARGFRVVCNPRSIVWHDIPPPEVVNNKARLYHVHSPSRAYFAARNRILFMRKYSRKEQFLGFILIFNWLLTLYYMKQILNLPEGDRMRIAQSYLKGALEGLVKITRMSL